MRFRALVEMSQLALYWTTVRPVQRNRCPGGELSFHPRPFVRRRETAAAGLSPVPSAFPAVRAGCRRERALLALERSFFRAER